MTTTKYHEPPADCYALSTPATIGERLICQMAEHALATKAIDAAASVWVWDPQVPGVIGLVRQGTNRADVIVYVDDEDFEVSDDWEMEL